MKEKRCLNCEGMIKGRADKKYCTDQCRAQYNNTKMMMVAPPICIKNINTILKRNRRILEEIIDDTRNQKSKVLSRYLYEKGYNFHFQTHMHTAKTGLIYFFCYEYGYTQLDKDRCMVIKKEHR
jgi:hypothetical protein